VAAISVRTGAGGGSGVPWSVVIFPEGQQRVLERLGNAVWSAPLFRIEITGEVVFPTLLVPFLSLV
jgi:hypothetical protein